MLPYPILTFHPQRSLARPTDTPGSINAFIKVLRELVCAAQMPGIKDLIDDNSDSVSIYSKKNKKAIPCL
jgi:hypothetical protein